MRSELWKCAGCSGLPASEWALSTVLNHPRPAHMHPHVCPRELVQAEAQEHIVGADKGQLNAQFYVQGKLWQGVGMKPITCQNNLNRNSPLSQRTGRAARPQMPPGEHVNSGTPRPHHCLCHHPVTKEKGDGLSATPWAGRLLLTLSVILLLTPRSISMLSHSVTPMA